MAQRKPSRKDQFFEVATCSSKEKICYIWTHQWFAPTGGLSPREIAFRLIDLVPRGLALRSAW